MCTCVAGIGIHRPADGQRRRVSRLGHDYFKTGKFAWFNGPGVANSAVCLGRLVVVGAKFEVLFTHRFVLHALCRQLSFHFIFHY